VAGQVDVLLVAFLPGHRGLGEREKSQARLVGKGMILLARSVVTLRGQKGSAHRPFGIFRG
jgi:hypothetical protein